MPTITLPYARRETTLHYEGGTATGAGSGARRDAGHGRRLRSCNNLLGALCAMRIFRALTLGCTALFGGCFLLVPQITYDLTASVVGAVGREDIRRFAGDRYVDSPSFPGKFLNGQGQVIRVRLSTSKDLVSFANKTSTFISVKWHLCDIPEKDVVLGHIRAFVDGVEIPWIKEKHVPVLPDRQGRFVYDAILYTRGWFMNEETAGVEAGST